MLIKLAGTIPIANIGNVIGSWTTLQGDAWVRASMVTNLTASAYVKASYWACVPWFSAAYSGPQDVSLPHEARAELAFGLKGASAALELFIAAEHLFDDVSTVGSGPTSYEQIGLRIRPR